MVCHHVSYELGLLDCYGYSSCCMFCGKRSTCAGQKPRPPVAPPRSAAKSPNPLRSHVQAHCDACEQAVEPHPYTPSAFAAAHGLDTWPPPSGRHLAPFLSRSRLSLWRLAWAWAISVLTVIQAVCPWRQLYWQPL